jgi:riboflavin kinase/FMN adenylyltransferase
MKIYRSPAEVPASFGPSVVTIGNFDGVHEGHRAILRKADVVLTFDPHPAKILAPERAPKLLMTMDQRFRAMEGEGIKAVLALPFSDEFAKLSPQEFADQILKKTLNAKQVLVGEDFRFGYKQSGDVNTLREMGFDVRPVPAITGRDGRISSTKIRALIAEGNVSKACRALGAPFALEGDVVKGHGIGSKQTVPTLNLAPRNEVLPKNGVYVTRTRDLESDRRWPSITNVGFRPTFDGEALTIETFLLEPLTNETPSQIEVQFLKFVRDERKFETPEALKKQILHDAGIAVRLHRRIQSK